MNTTVHGTRNISYTPLPPTQNPNIAAANGSINNISNFMRENGIHFPPISAGSQGSGVIEGLSHFFTNDRVQALPPEKLEQLKTLLKDLYSQLQKSGFYESRNFNPGGKLYEDFRAWEEILNKEIQSKATPTQPPSSEGATTTTQPGLGTGTTPPETATLNNAQPIPLPLPGGGSSPPLSLQQLTQALKQNGVNFTSVPEKWADLFNQGVVAQIQAMEEGSQKEFLKNILNSVHKAITGNEWDGNPLPQQ